jgi:lipoprotein-anchoring transpeptidase ErfK/SrfK
METKFSRRDFLKLSLMTFGAAAFRPWVQWNKMNAQFPDAEHLGRVCVGKLDLRAKPSVEAASVKVYYEDAVIPWLRQVVGERPMGVDSHRWVETPEGYLYSPSIQPVKNQPNKPVEDLPNKGALGRGMWVEVTVPYVDLFLANPPARSVWLSHTQTPRLYYSQVLWADDIKKNDKGQVFYRINEKFGYGDIFWAAAEAFRPITEEELAPISPDVENKKVVVDLNHQTLSCLENEREVYFCRISSGAKFDAEGNPVDKWSTPLGPHLTWRKLLTIHMSGGTTGGGYDLPGIAWTNLFSGDGVAIHSTFWHNDYGVPRSHGCVNCRPEDAKWIFRWTSPHVAYDPGDVTVPMPGGTTIDVIEG